MTPLSVIAIREIGMATVEVIFSPERALDYRAGQYLILRSPVTDTRFYFSIASAPLPGGQIVIQIGGVEAGAPAYGLVAELRLAHYAHCEGIGGDASLRESDRPLVMIAGGSGYTYARALLMEELRSGRNRSLTLIWGACRSSALYEYEWLHHLAQGVERLTVIPVVLEGEPPPGGHRGNLLEVTYGLGLDFPRSDLYVCGRPEMVRKCRAQMVARWQLDPGHFYSDVQ